MLNNNFSIRWHGRAGQGAVSAAGILASAIADQGGFVQAFPEYGAEKRGAPVIVFNRISAEPILLHGQVLNPDLVVVSDSSLLETENILDGLVENGKLLISTSLKNPLLKVNHQEVYHIDANKIAYEELKKNIPTSALLGSVIKILNLSGWDKLQSYLEKSFQQEFPKEIAEGNIRALKKGYEEVYKI